MNNTFNKLITHSITIWLRYSYLIIIHARSEDGNAPAYRKFKWSHYRISGVNATRMHKAEKTVYTTSTYSNRSFLARTFLIAKRKDRSGTWIITICVTCAWSGSDFRNKRFSVRVHSHPVTLMMVYFFFLFFLFLVDVRLFVSAWIMRRAVMSWR